MPVVEQRKAGTPPRNTRTDLNEEYRNRFLLPDWREKRQAAVDRQHGKCAGCGRDDLPLQGHHLSYRNLGKERWHDLIAVCAACHPYADWLRKSRKRLGVTNLRQVEAWAREQGLPGSEKPPGQVSVVDWNGWRHAWMLAHLPGFIAKEKAREDARWSDGKVRGEWSPEDHLA